MTFPTKTLLALGAALSAIVQLPAGAQASAAPAIPAAAEEFPIPAGFKPGYREADGIRFHYVIGGRGPLVLLVHGFPQTWYEWHQLMPSLARNHTVVAIDLPGLGRSGTPRSYLGTDVGDAIYHLAKSFSPDAPFDIVAHDVGIWNTYSIAAKHPADVRRYVAADAPLPDERLYTLPAFTPQGESLVWHFSFFNVKDDFAEKLVAGREPLLIQQNILSHATRKDWLTPEVLRRYGRSYAKPGTLHAAFGYYRALNADVASNKALRRTKLTTPVLALGGGGHGGLGTFMGHQWRDYASNVKQVVLPGCGHWLPEECPAAFNSAVTGFLDADTNDKHGGNDATKPR